ncbi:heparan-alpha-glucosaminide N-acetyltransferase domain-containing protein [uncultured Tenacibaculum sp.]|uniref:heparan-alpha-glucosaminide N-acetyltransferase domain-containing protein n=1 Tax=uncultured Tenacibaculum sp. TaxID=174713 RepID=UPI002605758A|nr:heparan-alpha-glucosaminide N-acetyltransferase domain-containing protein [uncultured Tenacibaculum sp.]
MKKQNRVRGVDFVRGFSVLMMIPVHVMMLYSSMETWENTVTGNFVQLLERGSPIFLIVMGISFAFSRNANRSGILRKALLIIALGYVLNFLRFIVPLLLFGGFPESFVEASGLALNIPDRMWNYFLKGDMFQLVGISLFLIGLSFKFLIKNKYVLIILALIIMWLSKVVSGFQLGVPVIDYILNLLWGNNFDVYFPLFPWLSFILVGLYFGLSYQDKPEDANQSLFKPMLYFGIVFLIIGKLLCDYNYEYHFGDYYHLGPGGSMGLMGILLVLFWVYYRIELLLPKENYISKLLFYCSKNVTPFYILQWVLIYWLLPFANFSHYNEPITLLIIFGINLGTFLLLYIYNSYVIPKRKKKARLIQQTV